MCRNDELALAAHLHRRHALVPALDHATTPEEKDQRLPSIMRGVELLSALEPARVVHAHGVARLGLGARALEDLDVLEARGRLDNLLVHLSSGGERRRSSPRPPHSIVQMDRVFHDGESLLAGMIARRMRRVTYSCAFCGEDNEVFVDPSGGRRQVFTEDCTVCCRPNLITLSIEDDGEVLLDAAQEYEA